MQTVCISVYVIFSLAIEGSDCFQNDELQCVTCLQYFGQKPGGETILFNIRLDMEAAQFSHPSPILGVQLSWG